jgi:hypothetical protein
MLVFVLKQLTPKTKLESIVFLRSLGSYNLFSEK